VGNTIFAAQSVDEYINHDKSKIKSQISKPQLKDKK
jgi:hypothetical protein